jgi:hypothetical protein
MTTTTERGYGNEHQKLRARTQKLVDAGKAHCWRCTKLIPPGSKWDLGHDDDDRTKYMGPEHVACNRATTGFRTSIIVDTSREW